MSDGPRYLTATDLQSLGLTISRVADVLDEAFRHKAAGGVVAPPMTFFHRARAGWFNSMACWIAPLAYAGCKFQSCDSGNPARGLPSIQGLYLLCESGGGRMVALIDARWLTRSGRRRSAPCSRAARLARTPPHSVSSGAACKEGCSWRRSRPSSRPLPIAPLTARIPRPRRATSASAQAASASKSRSSTTRRRRYVAWIS
ncbi:MAG: hypothetical protein EXR29_13105 [Betaproteobacteria bacterium]|nr:hypothetical protein [Betaproteobacteria bacterium]